MIRAFRPMIDSFSGAFGRVRMYKHAAQASGRSPGSSVRPEGRLLKNR